MSIAKDQSLRFKQIQKHFGYPNLDFALLLGYSGVNSYTNLGSKGRKASIDVLLKLHTHHKNVNLHWLLTGIGNMLISDDINKTVTSSSTPSDKELINRIERLEQVQQMILKSINEDIT